MNFYKRFIGDYMRDTSHLSLMDHGAYTMLLDTIYATGKPLPAAMEALYRICRATSAAERKAVAKVADEFFPINGDGTRHNKRGDEEIAKEREYSESQRDRANRRWGNAGAMPAHIPKRYPNDASHSHSHKNKKQVHAPDGFCVSDRVARWAEEHKIINLQAHFDNFVSVAKAKGYRYADWDEALMRAIRDDWAKIGKGGERKVAL